MSVCIYYYVFITETTNMHIEHTSLHRSSQPHTRLKGMCCCQTVKSPFPSSFSSSVLSAIAQRLDLPRSWAASIHAPVKDLRQQSKLSWCMHTLETQSVFNCSSRDTDLLLSFSSDWCNPTTSTNCNSSEYKVWNQSPEWAVEHLV